MLQFFGQFHPAVIHFPIALLLTALVAEAAAWATGKPLLHHIGVFNLHLGALSAIVAAAMGWGLAATTDVETALEQTLLWHRWTGTAAALWALLTVFAWHGHRRNCTSLSLVLYRLCLFLGGLLVALSGFLGGVLIYGWEHYQWPS